jgi:hypothetical protein
VDPLLPYGDVNLCAAQLLRLARFPHAGDLIANSALYQDGEIAAFEELVGSHGGRGGQQTEAFLLHPVDMEVPPISNATEVFALLDERRDPFPERFSQRPHVPTGASPWALKILVGGVRTVRIWVWRMSQELGLM